MQQIDSTQKTFATIVNHMLEKIYLVLDKQPFDHDILEKDNVLSYKVPGVGEYVFNKQPPNKQIWVSSPITGPKRFNLGSFERFYNTRNKEDLFEYLEKEIELIKKHINK